MLNITPDADHPIPKNLDEEVADSLQENARVAANTATLMFELGMPFEMTEEDEKAAAKLFSQFDAKKKKGQDPSVTNPPELYQGNVALKLGALLNEYDQRIILDATQARTYIMNRLLELSSCGEVRSELRALELMGKMGDIGAFTEKSEVTITHRSSGDLKVVLQEKLQKLLTAEIEDVTPKKIAAELGVDAEENAEPSTPEDEVEAELDALARERAEKVAQKEEKDAE